MAVPPPSRHMTLPDAKAALRSELRSRRRAFVRAGDVPLIALPEFLAAHIAEGTMVAGYLPQRFEADPRAMMAQCRSLGARLALPHVTAMGQPMRFLRWTPDDPLETNALGIAQPLADAPEVTPGIILTPLIGFDDQLYRLGQGGGFYDRAFAAHRDALRIGVAWSVQQIDRVPVEPWDMPLHAVITEREAIRGDGI